MQDRCETPHQVVATEPKEGEALGLARIGVFGCVVAVSLFLFTNAFAQDVNHQYTLYIEERTLGYALRALARQADVELLLPNRLVDKTGIHPVKGRYTIDAALKILLEGTGISGGLTKGGVIVISLKDPRAEPTSPATKKSESFLAFVAGMFTNTFGHAETKGPKTVAEEIIVTARRMEERLQDVPISISVFNQKQLDDRNIVTAKDLTLYTPSLSVNQRFGSENTSFNIRGFTQDLQTASSVAVYFADVVAPRGAASIVAGEGAGSGSFFDLQNVQVLKGPQGTLFGRNTTGGAVLFVPKKPTNEFGGYGEISFGNYSMVRVQGMMNVPLGSKARLRVGFDRMSRDGYLKNISPVGPSRMGDVDYVAGRASLVVDVTPDIENYTIVSLNHTDQSNTIGKPIVCIPGFKLSGTVPTGDLSCAQIARQAATGDFFTVENADPNPMSKLDQWQVINTTTFHVTDHFTIKNIASYAQIKNFFGQEVFGIAWIVPPGLPGAGQYLMLNDADNHPRLPFNHQSTTTEELQFQGNGLNKRFIWQAGAYLELSDPLSNWVGSMTPALLLCTDRYNLQCVAPYANFGNLTQELRRTSFRNMGFYGQASYELTRKLKLTAGIRFTDDRSRAEDNSRIWRFGSPGDPPSLTCSSTTATLPDCRSSARQNSKAPTWLLDLDYKPVKNIMIYAKYSRGYRQGLVNPRALNPYKSFGPEKVDAYELGQKITWGGPMPGLLNVAVFYNNLTDQQLFVSWRNGALSATAAVNAGKTRDWGVEAELTVRPFKALRLDGSFSYLNTLVEKVSQPPAPAPFTDAQYVNGGLLGFPSTLVPEFQETLTATYALPLPDNVGAVSVASTFSYTDSYFVQTKATGKVSSVALLNLNLNWESVMGSPVDLSLFATNVTDTHYFVFAQDQGTGFFSRHLGEPQMFGARMRYRFGSER